MNLERFRFRQGRVIAISSNHRSKYIRAEQVQLVRYITFLQQPCSLDSKRNSLLSHLCDHLRDIIRTFTKRAACKSRRKVSNWIGDENMKREVLHRTRNIQRAFTWRELNMKYCNVRANELVVFPLELHENACPNDYHRLKIV